MNDEIKTEQNDEKLRTAVVAIIGRPSAGKSTFLNTACQEPVSIVSPIPQTTRNAIKGIVNTSFGQLIFIDGEAGTGKTVLNSSTFYDLYCRAEEEGERISCHLLDRKSVV